MKSKISFFNLTLLRKNTIRFSPIWITYLAAWLLAMPIFLTTQLWTEDPMWRFDWTNVARHIGDATTGFGPSVAFAYGIVLAMAVFSYLYQARSVSMLHSLPIKRSGLFVTNYASGLLFILVPNLIVMILTLFVTGVCGAAAPAMIVNWFLYLSAMEFFFYSFASFIAMFTGHILALPVFYCIYNCVAFVLYYTIVQFVSPYLYGMSGSVYGLEELVAWLTPLAKIYQNVHTSTKYTELLHADGTISYESPIQSVVLEGGSTLAVYALIGVILVLLAYWAYRCRHSETAGDVVSVGWAKVVFRYGVALTAAFTIGQALYYVLFNYSDRDNVIIELVVMILIAAVGFAVEQMLLNKSFRVIRKSLKGSGICAVIIVAILAGAYFDVIGYTRHVPDAEKVDSVYVNISGYNYSSATLYDTENIEKVTQLHRYIVDNRHELLNDEWVWEEGVQLTAHLRIRYAMADGSMISRNYDVLLEKEDLEDPDSVTGLTNSLVDTPEYRASDLLGELYSREDGKRYTPDSAILSYYEDGRYDVTQEKTLSREDATAVYAAVLEDVEAGNLPSINLLDSKWTESYANYLEFMYRDESANTCYASILLTENMTSTIAKLEELGIVNDRVRLESWETVYRDEASSEDLYDDKIIVGETSMAATEETV